MNTPHPNAKAYRAGPYHGPRRQPEIDAGNRHPDQRPDGEFVVVSPPANAPVGRIVVDRGSVQRVQVVGERRVPDLDPDSILLLEHHRAPQSVRRIEIERQVVVRVPPDCVLRERRSKRQVQELPDTIRGSLIVESGRHAEVAEFHRRILLPALLRRWFKGGRQSGHAEHQQNRKIQQSGIHVHFPE